MKEKYISCTNLNIKINDKIILEDFSMTLKYPSSIVILGESGTGKSQLLKTIKKVDQVKLNGDMDYYFLTKSTSLKWKEELKYKLQPEAVQKFLNLFFKNSQKIDYKIDLLKKVFLRPDFLLIEDLSTILTNEERHLLFELIKQIHVSVLYVTKDVEDIIYFPYCMVLKNNKVVMEGKMESVIKEEKLMKVLGYSLPFYVNLSIQLQLYSVIEKIGYNKEELERLLWQK